ncbi:hypothetical protein [Crocosphaera chwakensis]|uniref:Uncharacterized protein n=1 Tax=Crocosphaera chwakensis CCY0110 TaxID=391612 RepID=A3IWS7_9CHRO|nr:hypothetical protein [Crocosphaera chwakensis]EAZ89082.1 hypothetical protein CY0110_08726 [Crocosphaera chwakensis CCY0110]
MARKRFSDLERVYDALKLAKVDIGNLPANLDITKYAKWKEGETVREIAAREASGGEKSVGLIAFGLPSTDAGSQILVTTTNRAFDKFKTNADFSKLGITDVTTGYNTNGSFVPAKLTLTVRGTKVSATSDITGRKYKKNQGQTYTLPIGQTETVKYFQEKVAQLVSSQLNVDYFLSAQPEQWRRD